MDSSVIVLLIGSVSALMGLALKLCFASHCTQVKLCCGCLDVTRDITNEQTINLDNNQTPIRPP